MNTNKFIKYIFLAVLCFAFASCETDIDKIYVKPTASVTAPVLTSIGLDEIVVDEYNVNLVPLVLNWTRSDFGTDVLVEYTLEMATSASFTNPYPVTMGNNIYSKALSGAELSKWVIANFDGLDGDTPRRVELFMRIAATIALENPTVTISPDKKYSNAIAIAVTPYAVPGSYPEEMFMIGAEFGNWDWSSDGVAVMTPVHSNAGHFWCIRYFTANEKFKWNSKRGWGGDFNSLGENIGFELDGGDAKVTADGMYMVYMDMPNARISIEPAKVYGMGPAFGNWTMGDHPFTVENKTMVITTTGAAGPPEGLRMYANSTISPIGGDWWKMEFVPINGVIEYRGAGDDQPRQTIAAGVKIILDFNAGTADFQ